MAKGKLERSEWTRREQNRGVFTGELGIEVAKLAKQYDLAPCEVMLALAQIQASWAVNEVRDYFGIQH